MYSIDIYPQLPDGNVVPFGDGANDFQRNSRLIVLQSQCRRECRCLSHRDVSDCVQFLPQVHRVLERFFGVLPIASGERKRDRVFRIATTLHLTGFDQIEHLPHLGVHAVFVEQIPEDLVRRELIEEAVVFLFLEQLERQCWIFQVVQGTHHYRAEDVVAEAEFLGLAVVSGSGGGEVEVIDVLEYR